MSKKPPPKSSNHVLNGRRYAKGLLWRVDQDYGHKLSPRELEWLRNFNDAYYGADFRGEVGQEFTPEHRSEANRLKNAARRDLASIRDPIDLEDVPPQESPDLDASPVPEYLNDPAYKAALRDVRALLWNRSTHDWSPEPSKKLDRAMAKVQRVAGIRRKK